MLKESANKKKTKQQTQENIDNNDVIIIPESLLDLKDDGFILIPVSCNYCTCDGYSHD